MIYVSYLITFKTHSYTQNAKGITTYATPGTYHNYSSMYLLLETVQSDKDPCVLTYRFKNNKNIDVLPSKNQVPCEYCTHVLSNYQLCRFKHCKYLN